MLVVVVVVVLLLDELLLAELLLELDEEELALADADAELEAEALTLVDCEAWMVLRLDRSGTSLSGVIGTSGLNLPHRSNTRLVCEIGSHFTELRTRPK